MSVHKHGTTGPGCAGTCCLKATDLGVSFGGEEVVERDEIASAVKRSQVVLCPARPFGQNHTAAENPA